MIFTLSKLVGSGGSEFQTFQVKHFKSFLPYLNGMSLRNLLLFQRLFCAPVSSQALKNDFENNAKFILASSMHKVSKR